MYNRYYGNTGRVERVEEAATDFLPLQERPPQPEPPPRLPAGPAPGERRPPGPLSGLSGDLGRLLGRLSPARLEVEDLLLLAVLYLLYRESGDREFLFAIAVYLLL